MSRKLGLLVLVCCLVALLAVPQVMAASSDKVINVMVCRETFAAPAITTPGATSPSEDASVRIDGTGEPEMSVVLLVNDVGVAAVSVTSAGTFAADVPLGHGENRIKARTTEPCGTSKDSAEIIRVRSTPATDPGAGAGNGQTGGGTGNPPSPPPVTGLPDQPGADGGTDGSTGGDYGSGTDSGGDEGSSSDGEVPLEEPTIDSPEDGAVIDGDTVWISGTAEPGSTIDIYVNDRAMATVTADSNGDYGVAVPIELGANTVITRITTPNGATTTQTLTVCSGACDQKSGDGRGVLETVLLCAAVTGVAAAGGGAIWLGWAGLHRRKRRRMVWPL